jgi:hypothetical protein
MQPPSPTIRREDGTWSIELTASDRLITLTPFDLQVMSRTHLHSIPWTELIDLLDDLSTNDAITVTPIVSPTQNRARLVAWLLSQPGVVQESNDGSHGVHLVDDYDAIGYHT